jgi:hypothetical protein
MIAFLEPLSARNPQVGMVHYQQGLAWRGIAFHQYLNGEDPSFAIQRALSCFTHALEINSKDPLSRTIRASALLIAVHTARDPAARERALADADADLATIPAYVHIQRVAWHLAKAATSSGRAALENVRLADAELDAFGRRPDNRNSQFWLFRARVEGLRCRLAAQACNRGRFEDYIKRSAVTNPLLIRDAAAGAFRLSAAAAK